MNFAREGLSFIAIAAFIAVGTFGLALARRSWPLWLLAFALTIIALWVAYFFRDPERLGERGERLVIAPADGKIVMITEVDEPSFMKQRAVRISIFMNVFNVHVNRYPVSGIVRLVDRKAGRFLNAAAEDASLQNEQTSIGIETGSNHILVRQIAGLIARRIVTDAKEGDKVQQGARMGLIRFGRVDIFLRSGRIRGRWATSRAGSSVPGSRRATMNSQSGIQRVAACAAPSSDAERVDAVQPILARSATSSRRRPSSYSAASLTCWMGALLARQEPAAGSAKSSTRWSTRSHLDSRRH